MLAEKMTRWEESTQFGEGVVKINVFDSRVSAASTGVETPKAVITFSKKGQVLTTEYPNSIGSRSRKDDFKDFMLCVSDFDTLFEIRATVLSGETPKGSVVGKYLPMESGLEWSLSRSTAGTSECVLGFDVRLGCSDKVLACCYMTLTARLLV